jgi:hypothetical protein
VRELVSFDARLAPARFQLDDVRGFPGGNAVPSCSRPR